MKNLYIISVILSVVFGVLMLYYTEETRSIRWDYWLFEEFPELYSDENLPFKYTRQGAGIGLIFIVYYAILYFLTLKRVRSATARILSIIGLAFTAIALVPVFVMLRDPGNLYFDEAGYGMFAYAVIMLAFSIVNLVQVNRGAREAY